MMNEQDRHVAFFRGFHIFLPAFAAFLLFSAKVSPLGLPKALVQAEHQRINLINKLIPTVVAVMRKGGMGGGSGVLISSDGYALTNFHVTAKAGDQMACGLSDGKIYPGVIVGIDPTGDVALIKLKGRNKFPHARLGDSDELKEGDWVLAMGNPFMLATDFKPTVTMGIISGLHRYQAPARSGLLEYTDCIQTDASINPGNSGGPLFNMKGELIGINGRISFEKRVRVNSGFGYAISINQIKNFLYALRGGRVVDHATLGITVATSNSGRVVVDNILPTSDAYRRGLRLDDEIVSLAGKRIESVNQFKNILGTLPSNWRIPLVVNRGADQITLEVMTSGIHGKNWVFSTRGTRRGQRRGRLPRPHRIPIPKKGPGAPDIPNEKESKQVPGKPLKAEKKKTTPPATGKEKPAGPKRNPEIEKRPGFANFVFNRIEQKRVLDAFRKISGTSTSQLPGGVWSMRGIVNLARFKLKLAQERASLSFGDMDFAVDKTDLFGPPADDGCAILRGLILWRALFERGSKAFKIFYYEGRAPGPRGMADVIYASNGADEIRFLFNPDNGALLSLEVSFEPDVDPYRFFFGRPKRVDSWNIPVVFFVQVGDEAIGKFVVSHFMLASRSPGAAPEKSPRQQ